jgi:hypothetical protein
MPTAFRLPISNYLVLATQRFARDHLRVSLHNFLSLIDNNRYHLVLDRGLIAVLVTPNSLESTWKRLQVLRHDGNVPSLVITNNESRLSTINSHVFVSVIRQSLFCPPHFADRTLSHEYLDNMYLRPGLVTEAPDKLHMRDRRVSSWRTVAMSCTGLSMTSSGGGDAVGQDDWHLGRCIVTSLGGERPSARPVRRVCGP